MRVLGTRELFSDFVRVFLGYEHKFQFGIVIEKTRRKNREKIYSIFTFEIVNPLDVEHNGIVRAN